MVSIEEVCARSEIHQVLMRYVRGVDRRDPDLLESAYFADAVDVRSYSPAETPPGALAARVIDGFGETPEFSQHHMTNVIYDIDCAAGVADVESYVLVFHPVGPETSQTLRPADGQSHVRFAGARYLDRFERRDDEWRIARRVCVVDWSRTDLFGDADPVLSQHLGGLAPGVRDADPSEWASEWSTRRSR
ncbi:nuclear transport factor 2 family protein [Gordonia sp. NPDC058843]|uniref:nuclear transport factor 2 family protein n=1 Tax=Gordonia sp. NPDC058843 TaxID=3346648 RepID=UPI0036AD1D65